MFLVMNKYRRIFWDKQKLKHELDKQWIIIKAHFENGSLLKPKHLIQCVKRYYELLCIYDDFKMFQIKETCKVTLELLEQFRDATEYFCHELRELLLNHIIKNLNKTIAMVDEYFSPKCISNVLVYKEINNGN